MQQRIDTLERLALSAALSILLLVSGVCAQAPAPEEEGAPQAPLSMLRLRSGDIHWVRIQGHDPERLTVQRADTGGRVTLPWSWVDPDQERELRLRFGYVDVTDDEIMVDADRLVLIGGREVIGKIVQRTGDALMVKTASSLVPVPKQNIAAASTVVSVPALDIYTRDELYQIELANLDAEDPESHFQLAQRAERFLDFVHAFEHYTQAKELDPAFRADDVAVCLERSARKAEAQEQVDALQLIEQLRRRKRFDEAVTQIEAFRELYPSSSLMEDLRKKEQRVERSRERALQDLVVKRWHHWAGRLARQVAKTMSYDEILGYVEEGMSEDIVERVKEDVSRYARDIDEDAVRAFWARREGGRWRGASYGNATWLLGDEEARKGLDPAPKEKEKSSLASGEKDQARKKLAEKIERFMRHQNMVSRARAREDDSEDLDAFWQAYGSRYQWVLAYYAEHSGDMEVNPKPRFQTCRECGGEGVQRIIRMAGSVGSANSGRGRGNGGGEMLIDCSLCRRVGIVRRIHYR